MKKILLTVLSILLLNHFASGQGKMDFGNDFSDTATVSISSAPGSFNPANGPAGALIGSDYTASLYYLPGVVTDQQVFDSTNPIFFASADTHFTGTTGDPASFAGYFERGIVSLPAGGTVSVEVRAWYNGGGAYTSYEQALAAGQNVGESIPVPVHLEVGLADPHNLDGLLPFNVSVPEPTTLALLGLGGLSLWLFRSRK
jgi:PEP-CTERM motif